LTDISAITVRTEHHERDYPVPGIKGRTIRVNHEVVVIDLPAGQLVFPVKDPQRFIRFVEERRAALVGE
jgi:hypothetical protein